MRGKYKEDCFKLIHLIKYIRGTSKLPLILSANYSVILKFWIDVSFSVPPNMREHTGGGLSMGIVFPIVSSIKHNLNTWSSTETGVVVADYCMPTVIWIRYWLDAQGYDVCEKILFQDNKSAIFLENNGKVSISKCTKPINIWYYFVTYRIGKCELSVEWFSTGDMIWILYYKSN